MRIDSSSAPAVAGPVTPPSHTESPVADSASWTNPAASAALRSMSELLRGIEDGVVRNFTSVEQVRTYAVDLRSTIDILGTATDAIRTDSSAENDAFLPLMDTAGGGVERAESRLSSKELTATWPLERGEILAAIRRARSISENVADQLDPRATRPVR